MMFDGLQSEESVVANRILLAAASPLFRLVLRDVEEGGQITVTDCSTETLGQLVQYCTTGTVTIPDLAAQHRLQSLITTMQVPDHLQH